LHRIRIEHFTKLRETQASNDEIVLELFITRESSKGMVDISDSRGYYFFKDKEIKICPENISYLEERMYDSIKNITKV